MFGDKPEFSVIFFTQHLRGPLNCPRSVKSLCPGPRWGSLGLGFRTRLCEAPPGRSRPFLWKWGDPRPLKLSQTHKRPAESWGCRTTLGWPHPLLTCSRAHPPGGLAVTPRTPTHSGTTLDSQIMMPISWACACSQGLLETSAHLCILTFLTACKFLAYSSHRWLQSRLVRGKLDHKAPWSSSNPRAPPTPCQP